MGKKLLCEHSHDITSHPACFAEGRVKAETIAEKGAPWYTLPDYRIGYFDIETDGLKADFSTILSWCIKDRGGSVVYDVTTRKDLLSPNPDLRLIKSLIKEMSKYKIIVGYYSTKFDVPYVRTKALHYNLPFPEFGSTYHFDIYYTVKHKMNLSRNSLDNACDYLGIEGKTPLAKDIWRAAKYGDPVALDEVVEHNIGDVEILERVHDRLTPFAKWTKKSM